MTLQDPAYALAWRRYKLFYRGSIGLFVAYIPVFMLIIALFPNFTERAVLVLFVCYAGTWITAANVARFLRCPRCGQYFFGELWQLHWPLFLMSRCRHCGLHKYADRDPAISARSGAALHDSAP